MKTFAWMATGIVALAGGAANAGTLVEQGGYGRGTLAVAAIDRADWKAAEALLTAHHGASASDPARLINLGRVYMATGRPGMALSAWREAAASSRQFDVETGDGQVASTRVIAQRLIKRYEPGMQSAAVN